MKLRPRPFLLTLGLTVLAVVVFFVVVLSGALNTEVWERSSPLANAVPVTGVAAGVITLQTGGTFRPAGIRRRESVTPTEYDEALRTATSQGVVLICDLGDGRAFFMAEPRFYNWCGTRGYKGRPWAHLAGVYFQAPLAEILIASGYAEFDASQNGLSPRERWRLEGAGQLGRLDDEPVRIAPDLSAFRYSFSVAEFANYDQYLELLWKPPPD